MVFDGNDADQVSNTLHFETIIIGGGTVGLYMAARLLKDSPKRNVCIVESGDIIPQIESNFDNAVSIGRYHKGTSNGRYNGLGGGSSNWGGQLAEFEKADFERPDLKWPIGYEQIKSYYKAVYSFLGFRISISNGYFDKIYNNETNNKAKIENYYTVRLKDKDSVFSNYFKKEIWGKTLTTILNTTAYKIDFDKNIAKEVVCKTSEGRDISIKADKFIFASGTLGINQFFLSTQANHEVPWKSNTYIGKYFQDHLGGVIGRLKIKNEKIFRKSFEKKMINGIKVERKLKFRRKYRKDLYNGVVVFFKYDTKESEYIERFKLFLREVRNKCTPSDIIIFLKDFYRIRGYLFNFCAKLIFSGQIHEAFDENGVLVFVQSEQAPIAASSVTISKDDRLENGLFKICVNWDWTGREIDAIHDMAVELENFLKEQNIADIEIDDGIMKRNPGVLRTFNDTNHQCGGMKMSSSDKNGVVDSNCKVWGTDNVWVAGAAVFPSSGHANSTLTALALAERIVQNVFNT